MSTSSCAQRKPPDADARGERTAGHLLPDECRVNTAEVDAPTLLWGAAVRVDAVDAAVLFQCEAVRTSVRPGPQRPDVCGGRIVTGSGKNVAHSAAECGTVVLLILCSPPEQRSIEVEGGTCTARVSGCSRKGAFVSAYHLGRRRRGGSMREPEARACPMAKAPPAASV